MDEFGTISSIDSLPLPDGRHVKDFDAAQATAKKAARAAKNVAATGTPPQAEVIVAPPIPGSEPETAKQPQALESNASESQSLVPDTTITGEYVENTQSLQRNVEPISRAVLSSPGTTMQQLYEMVTH